jgi:dihydrofolate reductase
LHFLKQRTANNVLILGRTTYDTCLKWLSNDQRILHCVSRTPNEESWYHHTSLADAIAGAESIDPLKDIYIGGGAQLAAAAFDLLEAEGQGIFYETVVESIYPEADAFMPTFNEDAWTAPDIIEQYPAQYREKQTYGGRVLYEPVPAFHIQQRRVKEKQDYLL